VINVALLGIIQRRHIRDQIPLREIARRLGISRNTARRYLRSETTEPSYAERRIASGLDKYSVQLSGWLKAETGKPRKQRSSLKQIHTDLRELGYEGSYDRVAAFARQWKAGQTEWGQFIEQTNREVAFLLQSLVYNFLFLIKNNPKFTCH
jgi:transcriptional regulator with XRE-family HTH domain